ncbi:glycosyltransferase family 2 protein [Pedobacter hiemivivus]|uniref:Glycosyltransferase family 2 protein n=1 Tax=Pedobacter hiemivivus TaxID=2530454 RepID=A0A4R0NAK5_9SPHI|nr:glycosyltransferase family 2 protein [Pedobacter hiemivivus]TCC97278.1 glycosyltransferase family 2 protein [Pedobacter hiemivivus]
MCLISIIVPVYNVEEYIEKCISSLLQQTNKNFEIIIVDDQSPDQSINLASKLLSTQNAIAYQIITSEKNGGLSAARNLGISKSNGKFLLFVDSDDWIEINTVQKLVEATSTKDSEMFFFRVRQVYGDSDRVDILKSIEPATIHGKKALSLLFKGKYPAHICKILIDKKLFSDIKFPEGKIYEDVLTLPYLLYKTNNVTFIDDILYNYYQRSGSITKSYNPKLEEVIDQLSLMDHHFSEILSSKLLTQFKRYTYLTYHVIICHTIYYSVDFEKSKAVLLKIKKALSLTTLLKITVTQPSKAIADLILLKTFSKLFYKKYKFIR